LQPVSAKKSQINGLNHYIRNIEQKRMTSGVQEKLVIGNREKVKFPGLSVRKVTARIDTGAKSSSIHCDKVWIEKFGGKSVLCCYLLRKTTHVTRFERFTTRKVKSSNGHVQVRYTVQLDVQMGDKIVHTEFTLSNRDKMKFSVLLGRRFLKDRYIVDVSKQFTQTLPPIV
jgi:hypothetical protein